MSTKAIEQFLRPPSEGGAYTDERIAMLLAHAEDGKLSYLSCCCFEGIPSSDHALLGKNVGERNHHWARNINWAISCAYSGVAETDEERRAKLIPMIRAEMVRRDALRTQETREWRDNDVTREECFVPALTE